MSAAGHYASSSSTGLLTARASAARRRRPGAGLAGLAAPVGPCRYGTSDVRSASSVIMAGGLTRPVGAKTACSASQGPPPAVRPPLDSSQDAVLRTVNSLSAPELYDLVAALKVLFIHWGEPVCSD